MELDFQALEMAWKYHVKTPTPTYSAVLHPRILQRYLSREDPVMYPYLTLRAVQNTIMSSPVAVTLGKVLLSIA
ncbi:predicted protein [Plenodomus lingam JN3]|uniref:Predicted protein n=2 Tax=Leptosphaeria maculans TaxID=5022 RepID=E5AA52_LEPMJ|nr:predicted protein [Plenodomus lingam JN3]CBY00543.1 predicted protein [Plenodomus lingam JN3]